MPRKNIVKLIEKLILDKEPKIIKKEIMKEEPKIIKKVIKANNKKIKRKPRKVSKYNLFVKKFAKKHKGKYKGGKMLVEAAKAWKKMKK